MWYITHMLQGCFTGTWQIAWLPESHKLNLKEYGYMLSNKWLGVRTPHIFSTYPHLMYRKTYNIRHTLVGDKIVDHSDVVGASPVGAAPTTSSFST